MANKRGSIRKTITLGQLIMAGLEIAPENAIQYKKDLPEITGMDILTLYTRVKELGFEIVPILALRPIKDVKNEKNSTNGF
jgi:hypothetical protein